MCAAKAGVHAARVQTPRLVLRKVALSLAYVNALHGGPRAGLGMFVPRDGSVPPASPPLWSVLAVQQRCCITSSLQPQAAVVALWIANLVRNDRQKTTGLQAAKRLRFECQMTPNAMSTGINSYKINSSHRDDLTATQQQSNPETAA